jgi:hypothetical protein|nr:MAG TPA: hypothetical protein [Caudoviricetes sp.]
MRTKEFIKKVEALGFDAEERGDKVYLYGCGLNGVAKVSKKYQYTINTFYREFMDLNEGDKGLLFDLIVEYISTPIEEREEHKKYYLRHKWINTDYNYLNYNCRLDVYALDRILSYNRIKGKFTLEEIEDIKEKYDTKLEDFEIVEVEE